MIPSAIKEVQMRTLLTAAAPLVLVAATAVLIAQQKPPSSDTRIIGVWKGTSIVTNEPAGGGGVAIRHPNLFIYTAKYFTQMRQDGLAPEPERPVLPPPKDAS